MRGILPEPPEAPPSPIPTGRGSRSASNEPFARFLERSLRAPALSLPGSSPLHDRHAPAKADLRSLLTGEGTGSLDRVLGSGRDFGVFRVTGHGVSVEELGGLIRECEDYGANWTRVSGGLGERLSWLIGSRSHNFDSGQQGVGGERYQRLSQNMKNVACKLEAIAEQIGRIMLENSRNQSNHKRIFSGDKQTVLSLYRFNHNKSTEKNQLPLNDEIENESCGRIRLSLHIPFGHCQIYVQSEEDHFSFDADPETLVVTIGKQIEEWSDQEFKCVSGKMIFVPSPGTRASRDYSFSIELKLSSTNSSNLVDRNHKSQISIFDQIIFAIMITLLYKIYIFLTS